MMAKTKKETIKIMPYSPPPDNYFWFYVGDKYYKRLQPIPYKHTTPNINYLKKILDIK